ncbi:zinc-ribbon domain-containing protein [Atopostipes suicloacalis DSM 15692]|uniref:Zinc-ribbon domain-containing protein n=1 Tax=Atopostipes suicloacalis DSM 15692 TaxID=1121025 RepID=A0A1M4X072_9LACT|nr:zinc ribbon domain-containing protein [Atopostipes suicloacalis]SHE86874.1 zinc-ribbon domain-containing protein [Atopostipes suicloacalis DSM 15692]
MNKDYKFCPNCGEQLMTEDNFCQKCGFNFEAREVSGNAEYAAETKDQNRKHKQLGFIGGVILLLLVVVYFFMNKMSVSVAGTYVPSNLSSEEKGLLEISRNGKTKLTAGDFEESIELIFYIEPFGSDTYRLDTEKDLEIRYAAPIDATEFDYVVESTGEDFEQYGLTVDYENGMGILSGSLTSEEIYALDLFSPDEFELNEFNGNLYLDDELLIKQ